MKDGMLKKALSSPDVVDPFVAIIKKTMLKLIETNRIMPMTREQLQQKNRTCRGCGRVFRPLTSRTRYGSIRCKKLGSRFRSFEMPDARITHP